MKMVAGQQPPAANLILTALKHFKIVLEDCQAQCTLHINTVCNNISMSCINSADAWVLQEGSYRYSLTAWNAYGWSEDVLSSVCTIVAQPGGVACGSGAELPDADRRDSDGESFPGHGSQP